MKTAQILFFITILLFSNSVQTKDIEVNPQSLAVNSELTSDYVKEGEYMYYSFKIPEIIEDSYVVIKFTSHQQLIDQTFVGSISNQQKNPQIENQNEDDNSYQTTQVIPNYEGYVQYLEISPEQLKKDDEYYLSVYCQTLVKQSQHFCEYTIEIEYVQEKNIILTKGFYQKQFRFYNSEKSKVLSYKSESKAEMQNIEYILFHLEDNNYSNIVIEYNDKQNNDKLTKIMPTFYSNGSYIKLSVKNNEDFRYESEYRLMITSFSQTHPNLQIRTVETGEIFEARIQNRYVNYEKILDLIQETNYQEESKTYAKTFKYDLNYIDPDYYKNDFSFDLYLNHLHGFGVNFTIQIKAGEKPANLKDYTWKSLVSNQSKIEYSINKEQIKKSLTPNNIIYVTVISDVVTSGLWFDLYISNHKYQSINFLSPNQSREGQLDNQYDIQLFKIYKHVAVEQDLHIQVALDHSNQADKQQQVELYLSDKIFFKKQIDEFEKDGEVEGHDIFLKGKLSESGKDIIGFDINKDELDGRQYKYKYYYVAVYQPNDATSSYSILYPQMHEYLKLTEEYANQNTITPGQTVTYIYQISDIEGEYESITFDLKILSGKKNVYHFSTYLDEEENKKSSFSYGGTSISYLKNELELAKEGNSLNLYLEIKAPIEQFEYKLSVQKNLKIEPKSSEIQELTKQINEIVVNQDLEDGFLFKFQSSQKNPSMTLKIINSPGYYVLYVSNEFQLDLYSNYHWQSQQNILIIDKDHQKYNKEGQWYYGLIAGGYYKKISKGTKFSIELTDEMSVKQLTSGQAYQGYLPKNYIQRFQLSIQKSDTDIQFSQKTHQPYPLNCEVYLGGTKQDQSIGKIPKNKSLSIQESEKIQEMCKFKNEKQLCQASIVCQSEYPTGFELVAFKNNDPINLLFGEPLHIEFNQDLQKARHFNYLMNANYKDFIISQFSHSQPNSIMFANLLSNANISDPDFDIEDFYPTKKLNNKIHSIQAFEHNRIYITNDDFYKKQECDKKQCLLLISVFQQEAQEGDDDQKTTEGDSFIIQLERTEYLSDGKIVKNLVEQFEYQYYQFYLYSEKQILQIKLSALDNQFDGYVYLNNVENYYDQDILAEYPDKNKAEYKDESQGNISLTLKNTKTGYYYLGVYGQKAGYYQISFNAQDFQVHEINNSFLDLEVSKKIPSYILYTHKQKQSFKIVTSNQEQSIVIKVASNIDQTEIYDDIKQNRDYETYKWTSEKQNHPEHLLINKESVNFCHNCDYLIKIENYHSDQEQSAYFTLIILKEDQQNFIPNNQAITSSLEKKGQKDIFEYHNKQDQVQIFVTCPKGNVDLTLQEGDLPKKHITLGEDNTIGYILRAHVDSDPIPPIILTVGALENDAFYHIQVFPIIDFQALSFGIPTLVVLEYEQVRTYDFKYKKGGSSDINKSKIININFIMDNSEFQDIKPIQGATQIQYPEITILKKELNTDEYKESKCSSSKQTVTTVQCNLEPTQNEYYQIRVQNPNEDKDLKLRFEIVITNDSTLNFLLPQTQRIGELKYKQSEYYELLPPDNSKLFLQIWSCQGSVNLYSSANLPELQTGKYNQKWEMDNKKHNAISLKKEITPEKYINNPMFIQIEGIEVAQSPLKSIIENKEKGEEKESVALYVLEAQYYKKDSLNPYEILSFKSNISHKYEKENKNIIITFETIYCADKQCNNMTFNINKIEYEVLVTYGTQEQLTAIANCYPHHEQTIIQHSVYIKDENITPESLQKTLQKTVVIKQEDLPELFDMSNEATNQIVYTVSAHVYGDDSALIAKEPTQKIQFLYNTNHFSYNSSGGDDDNNNNGNKNDDDDDNNNGDQDDDSGSSFIVVLGICLIIVLLLALGYFYYKKKKAENLLTYQVEDVRNVAKVTDGIELNSTVGNKFAQFKNERQITTEEIQEI